MAGHNKWSQIKRAKGAADAKRAQIFAKLAREVSIAVKESGISDPDLNPRLRLAVVKCKAANMPADNIQRAIAKGEGTAEGAEYVELSYEIFGPGGVAILASVTTDNRNRTAAEIRHILSKNGGNIATAGAVSRLFDRKGQIIIARDQAKEDELMELALEAGAEDFQADENGYEILTEPSGFEAVHRRIEEKNIPCEIAEVTQIPITTVPVEPSQQEPLSRLLELLEDHDDVNAVYSNADLPASG